MLEHKDMVFEIDELFPQAPEFGVLNGVPDVLYSNLVRSFEQSIEDAMRPIEALTTILGWVSCELARINIEDSGARVKTRE